MITIKKAMEIIEEGCNDVIFDFNGLKSGVTSEVEDSIPTYQLWHGDSWKEYDNLNELMEDKFFSGKSLNELIELNLIDVYFA